MDKVEIQKLKELDVNRLFDNLIDKEVTNLNLIDLIKHFTGFENIRLKALYDDILDYLAEHDKVVDACSYQFGTVFIKKHKFETIYKLWELTNKYRNNKPHLQTEANEIKQRDDFIILEMLATNEIQIIDGVFFYNNREYERGHSLSKVINENKGHKPLKNFTQYLNNFKNKTGDKYYLDLIDSVNNKANKTNIDRLRDFKNILNQRILKLPTTILKKPLSKYRFKLDLEPV
jgi:hypothetical protein